MIRLSQDAPRRSFRLCDRIIAIVIVLAGGILAAVGIWNVLQARASEAWPSVEGIVERSEVVSHRSKGRTTYHAEVEYRYSVGGTEYKGDRVSFGELSTSDRSHAARIVERYRKGARVSVRHEPDWPGVSVLHPGLRADAWFMPAGGAALAVFGVLVGVFGLGRRRRCLASDRSDAPRVAAAM